ncbi:hypothetical protein B0A54_07825 [Friedmanniomyces endolithicus]|uniref:Uncharacterized protein n=1 Tax=Friedmanniomyces endolithicus TaxID=329885 RepID=A0A4U0UY21_9PEZI|nr:hypothetical protein B0A54_07825 [Friedmanniomyces endolithicus]
MNSSLRLSEQLPDALPPNPQPHGDASADRSLSGPAKPSMEEIVKVSKEEAARRRVAQVGQEQDRVNDLTEILAQSNEYIKNRRRESYVALLAEHVEGMTETVNQAAGRGDTKSVRRYCMLTTNAAVVAATMIFLRSKEEKQDKLRAAEERIAIRQQERWLRMKARHSFRLRCLSEGRSVVQTKSSDLPENSKSVERRVSGTGKKRSPSATSMRQSHKRICAGRTVESVVPG